MLTVSPEATLDIAGASLEQLAQYLDAQLAVLGEYGVQSCVTVPADKWRHGYYVGSQLTSNIFI